MIDVPLRRLHALLCYTRPTVDEFRMNAELNLRGFVEHIFIQPEVNNTGTARCSLSNGEYKSEPHLRVLSACVLWTAVR